MSLFKSICRRSLGALVFAGLATAALNSAPAQAATPDEIKARGKLMVGVLTLISTMFVHVVRSEIGRIDTKIDALSDRFDSRLDDLDRDVQALIKHTFGIDRG